MNRWNTRVAEGQVMQNCSLERVFNKVQFDDWQSFVIYQSTSSCLRAQVARLWQPVNESSSPSRLQFCTTCLVATFAVPESSCDDHSFAVRMNSQFRILHE
jgi:hypothetical protein